VDVAATRTAVRFEVGAKSALPLAIVVSLVTLGRAHYAVDDALIFAQFARNLVERGEWAFNPGEPVYATTSVLWPLCLVPLELGGWASPTAVALLYALGLFWLAHGVGVVLEPLGAWAKTAGSFATALHPLLWAAAGMETSLFLALVVWAIVAHGRGRQALAGMLLGLGTLARPDAALVGVLMLADLWSDRRVLAWRTVLVAALCCVPWIAYAMITFGTPLPTTLAAKTAQSALGWWAEQPAYPIAALCSLPAWPLALACLIASALPSKDSPLPRPLALLFAFGIVQTAVYAAIGAPSGYSWYHAPLALSAVVAAVAAARHVSAQARWAVLPAAAVFAVSCVALARAPRVYRHSIAYREAAQAIAAHCRPSDRIAAAEIGYLGYVSRLGIVDVHGLIHARAGAAIASDRADWWTELRPRFVVTHEPGWYAEPQVAEGAKSYSDSAGSYELFARFAEPNGTAVVVWRARDER
jgi:hypothetical protein